MTEHELMHRFQYHPPSSIDIEDRHQDIRDQCLALGNWFNIALPESDEKRRVFEKLDEVLFLANASVARTQEAP